MPGGARTAGATSTGPARGGEVPDTRPPPVEPTGERPLTLRVAAVASGVESLAALLYAVLLALSAVRSGQQQSVVSVVGLVVVFAAFGAGLTVCAVGLWRARRRPRAPAAVVHALLVLIGVSVGTASVPFALAFLVVGGGGLATLFARPTSRALGSGRLPGS